MGDIHTESHQCSRCGEILSDLDNAQLHKTRHRQESQIGVFKKQRQREMDDDFVLCYVKANRLNEYEPRLDYEPDFRSISSNYLFEKEEWLMLMNKFKPHLLHVLFESFEDSFGRKKQKRLFKRLNAQILSYLLEYGALSVIDAIDFLNHLLNTDGYEDHASAIVSNLLQRGCNVKTEWVAKVLNDDELIQRIKEKCTYTFDEIHKARQWDVFSPFDVNKLKTFGANIQKHFYHPKFKYPMEDLPDFGVLPSFGQCKKGLVSEHCKKNLDELWNEYTTAITEYADLIENTNHFEEEWSTHLNTVYRMEYACATL